MDNRVYHIEKDVYYDMYGTPGKPTFYIKYEDAYLRFFKKWRYVMYYEHGYDCAGWTPYKFGTLEQAQTFIDEVLCKGLHRQKTITEVVDTVRCK